jgi:hypothetical protein
MSIKSEVANIGKDFLKGLRKGLGSKPVIPLPKSRQRPNPRDKRKFLPRTLGRR